MRNSTQIKNHPKITIIKKTALFLLLSVIFACVYTQSPLFTSNQNQYFLHGMAQAKLGSLSQDWLANTLDPTPVFSFFVKLTFQLIGLKEIFYFYYVLLMGLYCYSLLGILDSLFQIYASRIKKLLSFVLIIVISSAALRFELEQSLGANWSFLFDGGLAGQRALGLVFQPSIFGIFLIFSIHLFLKEKPFWAIAMAVLAASVHPTYLLSAVSLGFGYLFATWIFEKEYKKVFFMGLEGLLLAAPILIYVFSSFVSSQTQAQANEIMVNFHIPYHAIVKDWFDITSIIKITIFVLGIWFIRQLKRIFIHLLFSAIIAGVLTIFQVITQNQMLALIFPWRLSIYLVPICTMILGTQIVIKPLTDWVSKTMQRQNLIQIISGILLLTCFFTGILRTKLDFDQQNTQPEQPMLTWVKNNSTDQDIYLVDPQIKDFRLATLRPIYSDLLAVPYAGDDVLTWYSRVMSALKLVDNRDCSDIVYLQHDGGITHIILDKKRSTLNCPQLITTFEDSNYVVYKIIKK